MADRPLASVSDLDAFRARRKPPQDPAPCHFVSAAPGEVLLRLAGGPEVPMTPAQARVWSERLAYMADAAEGLQRDSDALVRPEGSDPR